MTTRAMRIGLVGTGHWARTVHGAALAANRGVELVGVWGRRPEQASMVATELGTRAVHDLDELFDEVEAVAFAVPPNVQAELATRAIAAGCHVLLEKPVALTVAAADRLVDAVDAAGVRSIVFFTNRFVPSVAAWVSSAEAGAASSDMWLSAAVRLHASIFEAGNPFGESPWRREFGALWDVGPHVLSVVLPMMGAVERVVADRGHDGAVEVIMHHPSGKASTMSLSLDAPPGSRVEEMRFFGLDRQTEPPPADATPLQAMTECIQALTAVSTEPWTHPCDIRFGRDVVAILDAAQSFLDRDETIRTAAVLPRSAIS